MRQDARARSPVRIPGEGRAGLDPDVTIGKTQISVVIRIESQAYAPFGIRGTGFTREAPFPDALVGAFGPCLLAFRAFVQQIGVGRPYDQLSLLPDLQARSTSL